LHEFPHTLCTFVSLFNFQCPFFCCRFLDSFAIISQSFLFVNTFFIIFKLFLTNKDLIRQLRYHITNKGVLSSVFLIIFPKISYYIPYIKSCGRF